ELRRDDVALTVPAELFDRRAHDLFGLAARVHLGVVEEVDARVMRDAQALEREIVVELRAEGHPRAEGQQADLEPGTAETAVLHDVLLADGDCHSIVPHRSGSAKVTA